MDRLDFLPSLIESATGGTLVPSVLSSTGTWLGGAFIAGSSPVLV